MSKFKEKHIIQAGPQSTSFKSFKIPLKSILLNSSLLSTINDLVIKINHLTILSYQFVRLYLIYCYQNNIEVELNDKFIKYAIKTLGYSNSKKPNSDTILLNQLEYFYVTEFQPIFNHQKMDLSNLSHFISNISVQILTCISNNCQERFISHIRRFINLTAKDIGTEQDCKQFKEDFLFCSSSNSIYDEWKNRYFNYILPSNIKESVYYDLKCNPLKYLKSMYSMSYILESYGIKTFQFFPLRTDIIPKHIMLDSSSLLDYFYDELRLEKNKTYYMTHLNETKSILLVSFFKFKR